MRRGGTGIVGVQATGLARSGPGPKSTFLSIGAMWVSGVTMAWSCGWRLLARGAAQKRPPSPCTLTPCLTLCASLLSPLSLLPPAPRYYRTVGTDMHSGPGEAAKAAEAFRFVAQVGCMGVLWGNGWG